MFGGKSISAAHMIALQRACNGAQHGIFVLPGVVQVVLALYETILAKWEAWDESVGATSHGDGGLGSSERAREGGGAGTAGARGRRAAKETGYGAAQEQRAADSFLDAAAKQSESKDSISKAATKRISSALLLAGAARVCAEGLHGGEASGAPPPRGRPHAHYQ